MSNSKTDPVVMLCAAIVKQSCVDAMAVYDTSYQTHEWKPDDGETAEIFVEALGFTDFEIEACANNALRERKQPKARKKVSL